MPRKSVREILHRVDSNLRIVEARPWPGKQKLSIEDFEAAAGVNCSNCHRECFRSRDGLCMECWEKANEFEICDKTGILEFLPKDAIMAIVRPAKKES